MSNSTTYSNPRCDEGTAFQSRGLAEKWARKTCPKTEIANSCVSSNTRSASRKPRKLRWKASNRLEKEPDPCCKQRTKKDKEQRETNLHEDCDSSFEQRSKLLSWISSACKNQDRPKTLQQQSAMSRHGRIALNFANVLLFSRQHNSDTGKAHERAYLDHHSPQLVVQGLESTRMLSLLDLGDQLRQQSENDGPVVSDPSGIKRQSLHGRHARHTVNKVFQQVDTTKLKIQSTRRLFGLILLLSQSSEYVSQTLFDTTQILRICLVNSGKRL